MTEQTAGLRPRRFNKRWPLALLAVLLISIVLGVAATILTARRLEGAVPGKGPILSLATGSVGFLVGTADNLYRSADGVTWSAVAGFAGRSNFAAMVNGRSIVVSGGQIFEVKDSARSLISGAPKTVLAVASAGDSLYVSAGGSRVRRLAVGQPDEEAAEMFFQKGPSELIALDVVSDARQVAFGGGLTSGLWRTAGGDDPWRQVLQTAARAVVIDEADPRRVYLGTAGGVLVSVNQGRSWEFTEMRLGVEALTQSGDEVFAVTQDRLIYKSKEGKGAWEAFSVGPGK